MPTYQYACTECGHAFEQVQSFHDDALTTCPQCEGRLRKLFGAVGVVFKGSGFYRTDSRGKEPAAASSESSSASDSAKGDSAKSDSSTGGSSTSSGSSGSSGSSASTSSSTSTKAPQPAST